jgi:hypothetical protein
VVSRPDVRIEHVHDNPGRVARPEAQCTFRTEIR